MCVSILRARVRVFMSVRVYDANAIKTVCEIIWKNVRVLLPYGSSYPMQKKNK